MSILVVWMRTWLNIMLMFEEKRSSFLFHDKEKRTVVNDSIEIQV